jgi:uncharacterized protein involved in exopolysaccharide biosynthesis
MSRSRNGNKRPRQSADAGPIGILLRNWKKVLFIPAFCVCVGAAIILFFPRTYQSEAKLLLKVGRESVGLDPTVTTGQTIGLLQNGRDDEMKSATELLTSRTVISQVVDELTPEFILGDAVPGIEARTNPVAKAVKDAIRPALAMLKNIDPVSKHEEAVIAVERALDVTAERGSTVVVCYYEADTPQQAQTVLAEIIAKYRDEHLRVHRNHDSLQFFAQQQEELRHQLDEATRKHRDAKNQFGLASIDGRRNSLENQFQSIELAKYQTAQEKAAAESRIAELQELLADVPKTIIASRRTVPNSGADLMRDQLYALRVREKDLQARYSADHPALAAVTRQAEEAQRLVEEEESERSEITDRINEVHQALALELRQLQGELAGLISKLSMLDEQELTIREDLKQLNTEQLEIDQLVLEEEVARNKWLKYTDNLEQARIDKQREESRISNVSMVQDASLSQKPVSPSKTLVGLASLLLAGAGTLAAVLSTERRRLQQEREQLIGWREPVPRQVPAAPRQVAIPDGLAEEELRESRTLTPK